MRSSTVMRRSMIGAPSGLVPVMVNHKGRGWPAPAWPAGQVARALADALGAARGRACPRPPVPTNRFCRLIAICSASAFFRWKMVTRKVAGGLHVERLDDAEDQRHRFLVGGNDEAIGALIGINLGFFKDVRCQRLTVLPEGQRGVFQGWGLPAGDAAGGAATALETAALEAAALEAAAHPPPWAPPMPPPPRLGICTGATRMLLPSVASRS